MTEARRPYRCFERLRVRASEVDAAQVVHMGQYLNYVDSAMPAYWRSLALPYAETMASLDATLRLRSVQLQYHAPAQFDEVLDVGVRCDSIGHMSLSLHAAVFRGSELLLQAELVYDYCDAATQVSQRLPSTLRDTLQAFEAGLPVLDVRVGSWADLGAHAGAIRQAVFVDEQSIPAEMEWDEADAACIHAVAYNRMGVALATGRLLEHVPGVAKIGRMAVLKALRGGRIGREVLEALMQAGRANGDREAVLHAQISARSFYERAGFTQRGTEFDEAGIRHVEMIKNL